MNHVVSTTYQDRQLAVLQELENDLKEVWKSYPVSFTEAEAASACLSEVVPYVESTDIEARSPSGLAAIKADQVVSNLLKRLNMEYRTSMNGNKRLLKKATIEDCKTILENKQKYRIAEDYCFLWRLISFWERPFISKEQYNRDAQAYRRDWFVRVHTMEVNRMEDMKSRIKVRIPECEKDLQSMAANNPLHSTLKKEIEQLKRVLGAVTENERSHQLQQNTRS